MKFSFNDSNRASPVGIGIFVVSSYFALLLSLIAFFSHFTHQGLLWSCFLLVSFDVKNQGYFPDTSRPKTWPCYSVHHPF